MKKYVLALLVCVCCNAYAAVLTVPTNKLPVGTAGQPYPVTQLLAKGGSVPYTWALQHGTALPVGLKMSTAGVLSGTLNFVTCKIGKCFRNLLVSVTDHAGATVNAKVVLAILAPTPPTVPLHWTASTSSNIARYIVYRSTVDGAYYGEVGQTDGETFTFTDTTVKDHVTYYYVATAIDTDGQESAWSNQVTVPVP